MKITSGNIFLQSIPTTVNLEVLLLPEHAQRPVPGNIFFRPHCQHEVAAT
jgi:hypothetical protein